MKRPFFGIITPSIQRESLVQCCESINMQTCDSWVHVVMVDCEVLNTELLERIKHPNRIIAQCSIPHRNFGNTCRHNAWTLVDSDYLLYTDDDNTLADNEVLEAIKNVLLWKGLPLVTFFPILRLGSIFMPDGEPKRCHVDTANLVVAREVGQWPDVSDYTADGQFVESLVRKHKYVSFPHFNPIAVLPVISEGK